MSTISKYLQISERLMLEYCYNTNNTNVVKNVPTYVLQDLNGKLMYFMNPDKNFIEDYYMSSYMYNAFPNKTGDHYFYTGYPYIQDENSAVISDVAQKLNDKKKIESVVVGPIPTDTAFDTVRIHIATGYTFTDTLGFLVSIRARQSVGGLIDSSDFTVILQNFVFHKATMSACIKFNPKPMYMSSKFYDRYIEFKIPSAYYMALHKNDTNAEGENTNEAFDVLNIDNGKLVIFDYCEITDDSFESLMDTGLYYNYFESYNSIEGTDQILYNQGQFNLTKSISAEIALNSNSDNFNAKIYEDVDNNCIRFYPIWGSITDDKPITRTIMNSIENGSIPMSVKGFTDTIDEDLEEFEKIYGEESRKWIIVNQIDMQFHYVPLLMSNTSDNQEVVKSQKFNITEDFEDDNDNIVSVDDLYKFSYRPIVTSISGYRCKYINVSYTARLVNRLNGEEVIRYATMDISDAESKYGTSNNRINVSNLYTWKLFNKNVTTEAIVNTQSTGNNKTKFITKYVNMNNYVMSDGENNAAQGDFVMRLYDTDHLYKITIYTSNDMNEPYVLSSTNATYLMRVTDETGAASYINPTYSINMALGNGELEFKISGVLSEKILKGNRRFHIVAKTETGITTLFAGKFESVFGE